MRPGFKQTEVGVIPEDWEVVFLGDLANKVGSGLTPTGGSKVYTSSGHPFVRSQNVGWGLLMLEELAHIDEVTHQTFPDTEICEDDVLLNITGASIGRSSVVDNRIVGGNVNQHVCIIRTKKDELSPKFLNLFLLSANGQQQIDSFQAGGNRQGLNFGQIRSFKIALPSLKEQHAIAKALGDADDLLASLDGLIAKKRAVKLAAMQQLLTGEKRLAGWNGRWAERSLISLADYKKELFDDGDWIESKHIQKSGIRLIQTGNIGIGTFLDKNSKRYISQDSFDSLRCKEVKPGDLLICRLAEPAGRACIMPYINEKKLITSVDVTIFRPLLEYADPRYLVQLFSSKWWFDEVELRCGGSTRSRIARGELGKIIVNLPPVEEQQAIATILSDMDAEISALQARRDKTAAIKQGMMQQLLTGETRLV